MMMLARFWRKMVEIGHVGAEILVPALEALGLFKFFDGFLFNFRGKR